jgi:hypothetical protein
MKGEKDRSIALILQPGKIKRVSGGRQIALWAVDPEN